MSPEQPTVVVIGGPNGAGKSTIAPALLRHLNVQTFVNADTIAKGLSGLAPDREAFAAGRIMLERIDALSSTRVSFAFESTLASRSFAHRLRMLKADGYLIAVIYLWLDSAKTANARVARRVMGGGHSVPEEVVSRRYGRSLRNLRQLYLPLADLWRVYNNSGAALLRPIARGGAGIDTHIADERAWQCILEA